MEDEYEQATQLYFQNHRDERQIVPLVAYLGSERVILGQAEVVNGMFSVQLAENIPPKIKDMIGDKNLSSFSAADVFDHDTPIFPANLYEVNAPLAEARLLDAVLGIRSLNITEGEANG